jgi:hypothetical protein
MATNLRLRPEAEQALRIRSERTGDSQQKIIRDAVDAYLAQAEESTSLPGSVLPGSALPGSALPGSALPGSAADLVARGVLIAARTPLRHMVTPLTLPASVTSLDLLNRDDRL